MIRVRHILHPASLLLSVALAAGCTGSPPDEASPPGLPRGVLVIDTGPGEVRIEVEIAETDRAKSRGLMGRESLPQDAGMVFLEDRPITSGFWMKDTLIPLTVAFWDRGGEIVRILDMEPCQADPCPVYEPRAEWVGAVEVNQGFFQAHRVQVGDTVRLER